MVVFGRRDTRLPGFPAAVEAARAAGFEPVVQATGGRAVAYTGAALVVDHVRHEPDTTGGQDVRFAEFGQRFVDLFRGLGVDARLGAVPGEYCPGSHSVNARGVEKLVGTEHALGKTIALPFQRFEQAADLQNIGPDAVYHGALRTFKRAARPRARPS